MTSNTLFVRAYALNPVSICSVRYCPALLISAPASGQGKTTVTAAMAAYHRSLGREVRVLKVGPDFIDPTVLERASGHPVYQLDLWMTGEADCRARLYHAAGEADLILIEGVMGLFDGAPSSADIAVKFGIPVLAVIDAGAMAQTFAAIACGLALLDEAVPFYGVVANGAGSERHASMLREKLPPEITFCASLPRIAEISFPERHLGLLQAGELPDIDLRIAHASRLWAEHGDAALPPSVAFLGQPEKPVISALAGVKIAVAQDEAFSFLYHANLDVLRGMGAELVFFSPLNDSALPDADSLYLPGGYPELHHIKLASNEPMLQAIRAHHAQGKPVFAECGGMLYALQMLTDKEGGTANLLGLMEGAAIMQPRLAALALQQVELSAGTLRGHTYHYSSMNTTLVSVASGVCPNGNATSEFVYRQGALTASYIHFYFPSDPLAAASLFLP